MAKSSAVDIKYRLDNLRHDFCLEETEDNWEKISKAMQAFVSVAENGGYEFAQAEVVNAVRNFHRPITNAMTSERTRLCGTALDLLISVANGLGHDFEQLIPLFMPTLLNVCGRTNKVVINRARSAILGIIESTQLASILLFFVQNVKDKAATLRLIAAEGTLACLNSCNPPDLEKEARARDIEAVIRGTARDANPDVRKVSRKIFESYKILLPSRVESFTAPLSPTMKKYLDIKPIPITKSTSNLRDHPERTAPNTTAVKVRGHMRAVSASTVAVTTTSQSKNLATKLTRVVRNGQPPVHPVQRPATAPRTDSGSHDTNLSRPAASTLTAIGAVTGPIRAVSQNTESKSTAGPSRSHPNATSVPVAATITTAITVAPRRLQVASDTKSGPVALHPSTTGGPRRVPISAPAPKKDEETLKKPSRLDSSAPNNGAAKASCTSLTRPTVPAKKSAATISRAPNVKSAVPKLKSTNANSTGTAPASSTRTVSVTKPLVIKKEKPVWGRTAPPPTKAAPSGAQKPPTKAVIKKPSSLISKSVTKSKSQDSASAKQPFTPTMVALPPSPSPSEPKEQEDDDGGSTKTPIGDLVLQVDSISEPSCVNQQPGVNIIGEDEDTDKAIHDTQTQTSVSVSPADSRLPTPTNEGSVPIMCVVNSEKPSVHNADLFGDDKAIPLTPENNIIPAPHDAGVMPLSAKTPISALLSSIERGFLYSPTTPLSPADAYLPGPNGTVAYRHETHAPRIEGPMRPFNYALHVMNPGEIIFSKIGAVRELDGTEGSVNSFEA